MANGLLMSDKTIEDYMLSLGKLALFIDILSKEQVSYISSGILTDDEIELAETLKWHCAKLMISMDDQVRAVGERTPKTWEETLKDIEKQLKSDNNEEKNGKHKKPRDKS